MAQLDFDASPFARYGIPGLVIAWFVWRDWRQSQIDQDRQRIQDTKIDQLVQSVSGLVRITSMEVMSRPNIVARAKAEAEEIVSRLPPTK